MNKDKVKALLCSPKDLLSVVFIMVHHWGSVAWGTLKLHLASILFGVQLGKQVKCFGSIHLQRWPFSTIRLGNNVTIVSSSKRCTSQSIYAPTKLRTWSSTAKIIVEDDVGLSGTSIVARSKTIRIGKGAMIAPNVVIMDSDFHAVWPPENRAVNPGFETDQDVLIGENVWIGSRVMVLKGVSIGKNSIIAAGSVVTCFIPENVVAGGVPARIIRTLK